MASDLSEREQIDLVKTLYRDINFSGAFSGISNLHKTILLEKGIFISKPLIAKAVNEIPSYVQHLRPIRKVQRSKYDVNSFGELCQADIAYMYDYEGFKYFVLLIDVFSHRVFTRAQKTKSKAETLKSFDAIIEEANINIYVLQTDRGLEFTGLEKSLRSRNIHWTPKVGRNKASFAEQAIGLVKRRLYKFLRSSGTLDWVGALAKVTENINNSPVVALGNETPNSIRDNLDEPRIRAAQKALADKMSTKQKERNFPARQTYKGMMGNLENYDKEAHKFKVSDYVYLDKVEDKFAKADEYQRDRVFMISEILKYERPIRFKLVGLLKPPEKIPGSFYQENLRLVPEKARPDEATVWKVSKVIKERTKKGKKEVLVSWQGYPQSYNSWIPKTNIVTAGEAD
jgi:hypothetical protein